MRLRLAIDVDGRTSFKACNWVLEARVPATRNFGELRIKYDLVQVLV